MLEQSLQDRIDVYLLPDYMREVHGICELWERKDSGRTKLEVEIPEDSQALCIDDFDSKAKCKFLSESSDVKLRTSVDYVLMVKKTDDSWKAYLIEMKSSLGEGEWKQIGFKVRASMLNIKAVAAVLDIQISEFAVYSTYEKLSIKEAEPTNIIGRKARLGGGWKENEWNKNKLPIYVPKGRQIYLPHKGVKMNIEEIDGKKTLCRKIELD